MSSSARLLLLAGCVAVVLLSGVKSAAIDSEEQEDNQLLDDYLSDLEGYLRGQQMGGGSRSKRMGFCLGRDMTCPSKRGGRDFCCRGSQCSCNIFGQNCKCSTIGLFQRLG